MKTDRKGALIRVLILTGLGIFLSAGMLRAETWRVTFSLPFETQWGGIVLPAGDYALRFDTATWFGLPSRNFMLLEQGLYNIGMVGVLDREAPRTPAKSQLLIVGKGKMAAVHILYMAELGTAFHFKVPETYEVYTQLIARADEPAVIQRIPVIVSGK